jgi:hypothetical protein
MSEWWTYSLSDFLLFAPRTYYRLFELYNADLWPAQILAVALGLAIPALLLRGGSWAERGAAVILASGWLWVASAFLAERYATINWAAEYFAWGFAAEALLLAAAGIAFRAIALRRPARAAERAGLGLFLFALVVQPLIGPLVGRPWAEAEIFGLAPDPTAVATLGLALLADRRVRWLLLPLPIVWCAISGATLWAMNAPDALVLPAAALLALGLAIAKTRSEIRRRAGGIAVRDLPRPPARPASVTDGSKT